MNLLLKILLACGIIALTCLLILGAYAVYQSLKKEDEPRKIKMEITIPKKYRYDTLNMDQHDLYPHSNIFTGE